MSKGVKLTVLKGLFISGALAATGCAMNPVDSFTLEVDLPANFSFKSNAIYRPATGETCVLPRRKGKRPEHKVFDTLGKPVANRVSFEVPLTEQVDGCPLVLRRVTFAIDTDWGERVSDIGRDYAAIYMLDQLAFGMPVMPESGVLALPGRCQWLFRTVGPKHALIKILQCNALNADGQPTKARVGGAVQRNELAAKTLRMALKMADEELPAVDDNWVVVPGGWKRCRGKSMDDVFAFCRGNTTDFKPFMMPDGRICNVYPSCEK
jgi:hypothetical protein